MSYISDIRFIPVKQKHKGMVGFINFTLDGKMAVKGVAVHERLNQESFRLVYPETTDNSGNKKSVVFPIDKKTQEQIEEDVNKYLKNFDLKG